MDSGKPSAGGMVELPPATGDAIMSGQIVAKVLAGRVSELGDASGDPAAELRLLKQVAAQRGMGPNSGNAPSERLYSWNMLSPVLARLRVNLSPDDKTLIVAGDEEVRCFLSVHPRYFPCSRGPVLKSARVCNGIDELC